MTLYDSIGMIGGNFLFDIETEGEREYLALNFKLGLFKILHPLPRKY